MAATLYPRPRGLQARQTFKHQLTLLYLSDRPCMNKLLLAPKRPHWHHPFTCARHLNFPWSEAKHRAEAEAKKAANAGDRRADPRTSLRSTPSGTSEVKVFAAADAYCFCPFKS